MAKVTFIYISLTKLVLQRGLLFFTLIHSITDQTEATLLRRNETRRVIWSLLLVGWLLVSCLANTINGYGNVTRVVSSDLASLSQPVDSKATFVQATADNDDSGVCEKSKQLLNQSHTDGNLVFLLFAFTILLSTLLQLRTLHAQPEPLRPPKARLHLTHCVFQE